MKARRNYPLALGLGFMLSLLTMAASPAQALWIDGFWKGQNKEEIRIVHLKNKVMIWVNGHRENDASLSGNKLYLRSPRRGTNGFHNIGQVAGTFSNNYRTLTWKNTRFRAPGSWTWTLQAHSSKNQTFAFTNSTPSYCEVRGLSHGLCNIGPAGHGKAWRLRVGNHKNSGFPYKRLGQHPRYLLKSGSTSPCTHNNSPNNCLMRCDYGYLVFYWPTDGRFRNQSCPSEIRISFRSGAGYNCNPRPNSKYMGALGVMFNCKNYTEYKPVYGKQVRRCTSQKGYDHKGGDFRKFRSKGLSHCISECQKNSRCKAFTYRFKGFRKRMCYLKKEVRRRRGNSSAYTGTCQ